MTTGAITQYIDVAQIVLYMFWIFFAGLIFYLHRENKREGYPLVQEGTGRVIAEGFPSMPKPKTYLLRSGKVVMTPDPNRAEHRPPNVSYDGAPGSPLVPTGNPMLDGVGPGGYSLRADVPDLTATDLPRIVPLRTLPDFGIIAGDTDPRGFQVVGTDGLVGGVVRDLWIDRAESVFRYLEVELAAGHAVAPGTVGATGARTVMLPMGFSRIRSRHVQVDSITGAQFALVPQLRSPEQITMLEEERVMAYYGAGTLYATPGRAEPLL